MDSLQPQSKPNLRPFSQRRQQVQKRRQIRRRRKKLGEGFQLIFGGGTQMVAMFIAVFLVVSGLWLWRLLEINKRLFGAPSTSDWEVMSQAVMHSDLALCDRINESITMWTPSEFPTLPVRTLRDECRERIIARNTGLHQTMQPLDTRWPSEPAIPAGWDKYKPKKLKEYDRLGEIVQTTEPADNLRQDFPSPSNESPWDTRPTPITSGLSAQRRRQSQVPAVDNQKQLPR